MFLLFTPSMATIFTACDCDFATTKGIVSLDQPEFCTSLTDGGTNMSSVDYTLFIKRKPPMKFKGYICEMWVKYKKIVGSFWIGDFDTTFSQKTLHVDADTCWRMINDQKCGMGLEENDMIKSDTIYSFQREPEGEGAWFSTKEYSVVNCHAREINLYQEEQGGHIVSPLGELNDDLTTEHYPINNNIIVWHYTDALKHYQLTCDPTPILQGKGVSYSSKINHGKIMDKDNQLEFIYDNTTVLTLCNGTAPVYKVLGVPDTYIHVIKTTSQNKRVRRELERALRPYRPIAKGKIRLMNKEDGYLTSLNAYEQLTLQYEHEPVDTTDNGVNHVQKFELGNDYILRIQDTTFCMGVRQNNSTIVIPFNNKTRSLARWTQEQTKELLVDIKVPIDEKYRNIIQASWIYDPNRKFIVDMDFNTCLTWYQNTLTLMECGRSEVVDNQKWEFKTLPGYEANLKWETVVEGTSQSKPSTRIPTNMIGEGSLKLKSGGCLSVNKMFDDVRLFPCAKPGEKMDETRQLFEYKTDYTIRRKNTNVCIGVALFEDDVFQVKLEPCVTETTRWHLTETGQLEAMIPYRFMTLTYCLAQQIRLNFS